VTAYLYEKDLGPMKYHILTAPRQDRTVRAMAARLGVGVQALRRRLIERLDMSDMENIPARWEAALAVPTGGDALADAIGRDLFVRKIAVFTPAEMEAAYEKARTLADDGAPFEDAVEKGKKILREVIAQ
jgi:energy-converting hydrogenase A subunit M